MRRYWKIYRAFVRSALVRELEFKANFFAKVGQSVVWLGVFGAMIAVFFGQMKDLAGWAQGETLILGATVFMMEALFRAFFPALNELPEQVRQGTLDFVVTRPVDSQFWISSRKFNFDQVGTFLAGLAMLGIGVAQGHHLPGFIQWLAYGLLSICALMIFYSFNLALMTTSIWFVRIDNLFVLSETATTVARYPLTIYPAGIQRLLTFMIPLGFLGTIPAMQLTKGANFPMIGWGLAWAGVAFLVSRRFWGYAIQNYSSASS